MVTIKSVVVLRDESGEQEVYKLVLPAAADIASSKLSVITPNGVAILGRHVGQTVRTRLPGGLRRITIREIRYQPESAASEPRIGVSPNHSCDPRWRQRASSRDVTML